MSTVVYLDRLPHNTESSYASTLFDHVTLQQIEEIYTHPSGGPRAWVLFKSPSSAQAAATAYDNTHFGPAHQKLSTSLTTSSAIPSSATNLLSVFKHNLANQLVSHTVEITNLPDNHTGRNLNQLLEPVQEEFDFHVPDPDPYFADTEPDQILHFGVREPGIALVQFAAPYMAENIVHHFAGTYWKNATLNARCVPDGDMEELLAERRPPGDGKDVKLFVSGIKAGSSVAEVQEIFGGYALRDVQIPPGGKAFCFVFARQEDASALLGEFGRGVNVGGRVIRVSVSEKGKKRGRVGGAGTVAKAASKPAVPTTDLKVNNLPYGVDDITLRGVFKDFGVSKVVIKNGYAFVGVASSEAENAVQAVHGRKIGDRVISVKIAERRK